MCGDLFAEYVNAQTAAQSAQRVGKARLHRADRHFEYCRAFVVSKAVQFVQYHDIAVQTGKTVEGKPHLIGEFAARGPARGVGVGVGRLVQCFVEALSTALALARAFFAIEPVCNSFSNRFNSE